MPSEMVYGDLGRFPEMAISVALSIGFDYWKQELKDYRKLPTAKMEKSAGLLELGKLCVKPGSPLNGCSKGLMIKNKIK